MKLNINKNVVKLQLMGVQNIHIYLEKLYRSQIRDKM
jgi:hypothetical protein